MAFDSLQDKLNKALKNVTGKGKLTEKNMSDTLSEIRMALLEADVNYKVVKSFLEKVKEKASGQEVLTSINPGQLVVKIVRDEIASLLGENESKLNYKQGLSIFMMVGLQGTGKTTSTAKIANIVKKKQQRKPLMIAADVIRPAAIEQLKVLGQQIDVEVFALDPSFKALEVVKQGLEYAKQHGFDTVFIDTAGRLHIDEELMNELKDIKAYVHPNEILLTVDAMTGQDIVNVASKFHELLEVTGLVVTKMDGDARGGGVLSVKAITNVPVKFVGNGEKIDEMDIFYPERMADRILGMGDIVTLVEKAQEKMDLEISEKSANRMMEGKFTLDDMLIQLQQVEKMGSFGNILKMIPGMNQAAKSIDEDQASKQMKKTKAIIQSMTQEEKEDPSILRASRKNRIAKGSGTNVADVNRLIGQYDKMKQMMKQLSSMVRSGKAPKMPSGKFPMPNKFGRKF